MVDFNDPYSLKVVELEDLSKLIHRVKPAIKAIKYYISNDNCIECRKGEIYIACRSSWCKHEPCCYLGLCIICHPEKQIGQDFVI